MINLTVNEKQASIISRALDLYSRLGIGQLQEVADHLPVNDDIKYVTTKLREEIIKFGREVYSQYSLHNIDGWSSNLGIPNPEVKNEYKIAYEMTKEIDKFICYKRAVKEGIIESMDSPRKWPEMFGVSYDGALPLSGEPFIEIEER